MPKKFISFKSNIEESKKSTIDFKNLQGETLRIANAISQKSSSILDITIKSTDENSLKSVVEQLSSMQGLVNGFLSVLHENKIITSPDLEPEKVPAYIPISGKTGMDLFVKNDRLLETGGLKPPPIQDWEKVSLSFKDENSLLRELRRMKLKGETISKSSFHSTIPMNMEEFTTPFRFLERVQDYNGAFLISLLKSAVEITNTANKIGINLDTEEQACSNGRIIILSVYDIPGSPSKNEEKAFVIILQFNSLTGELNYAYTKSKGNSSLSSRQVEEIKIFCEKKKIKYN